MILRFVSVLGLSILAGCVSHGAYSDDTNTQERKAYIACAVTRAFSAASAADARLSSAEIARRAVGECAHEREAVLDSLVAENAGKPFSAQFVNAYMDELHKTMLDHIALRLSQAREARQGSSGA